MASLNDNDDDYDNGGVIVDSLISSNLLGHVR